MTPAEQIRAALNVIEAGSLGQIRDDGLAALDALEAEHADRVWLTRDEAAALRSFIGTDHYGEGKELLALLDERIGDKPTSIRAMIDRGNMTAVIYTSTLDAVLLAVAVTCVAYAIAIFTVLARWHVRERQRRAERERRRIAQREQTDKDRRRLRLRVT